MHVATKEKKAREPAFVDLLTLGFALIVGCGPAPPGTEAPAAEGHADVVQTLLRHGSDKDILDVNGDKALDFAARNGHEEVVRLSSDS